MPLEIIGIGGNYGPYDYSKWKEAALNNGRVFRKGNKLCLCFTLPTVYGNKTFLMAEELSPGDAAVVGNMFSDAWNSTKDALKDAGDAGKKLLAKADKVMESDAAKIVAASAAAATGNPEVYEGFEKAAAAIDKADAVINKPGTPEAEAAKQEILGLKEQAAAGDKGALGQIKLMQAHVLARKEAQKVTGKKLVDSAKAGDQSAKASIVKIAVAAMAGNPWAQKSLDVLKRIYTGSLAPSYGGGGNRGGGIFGKGWAR